MAKASDPWSPLQVPALWRAYFALDQRTDPAWYIQLRFAIGPFKLGFAIQPEGVSELFVGDGEDVVIGRLGHHHVRNILRWDEFEILSRALSGPRWASELLLLRYVALTPDIADAYVDRLEQSLVASTAFTQTEAKAIVAKQRREVMELEWQLDATVGGWVVPTGKSSTRYAGGSFPFQTWQRIIEIADQR